MVKERFVFKYPEMQATVMYSKISNSYLPAEIQGEEGSLLMNRINQLDTVTIRYRNGRVEEIAIEQDEDNMIYEVQEFMDLILKDQKESQINSYQFSHDVMKVLDEVRRQIGLVYPADLKDMDKA